MAASVRTPLQTVHESVVSSDQSKSKSAYAKPQDSVSLSAVAAASSGRSSQSRRSADEPHIGRYRLLKTIGKGNFAKVSPAGPAACSNPVCRSNWPNTCPLGKK